MKTTVERLYVESMEAAMSAIKLPASQVQVNGSTKRNYTKVNQLILVSALAANKFTSNEWFSAEQAKEAGLSIKKDAQGTMLFSSQIKEDENRTYEKDGETKNFKVKSYRYYYVFNKDQLEKTQ